MLGGSKDAITVQSISDVKIGIVGLGRIGTHMARLLKGIGTAEVYYWSRTRKLDAEVELGLRYLPLDELCRTCDVLTNHESTEAGQILTREFIEHTKDGVLFINAGALITIDMDALYERISKHGARAAFDINGGIDDERFHSLPASQWLFTHGAGPDTLSVIRTISEIVTGSIINVLTTGDDPNIVNR